MGGTVQWPVYDELITSYPTRLGSGLVRALEKSARAKGSEIRLLHRMTNLVRDPDTERVIGLVADNEGRTLRIGANKGVILATGGHTSNVAFRRMFDPRLTEEYQTAGEPYSEQTADGELAAMGLGAALWGTASQTMEAGNWISKTAHIGVSVGLFEPLVAARQPDLRQGPRLRPLERGLAERHSGEADGPSVP